MAIASGDWRRDRAHESRPDDAAELEGPWPGKGPRSGAGPEGLWPGKGAGGGSGAPSHVLAPGKRSATSSLPPLETDVLFEAHLATARQKLVELDTALARDDFEWSFAAAGALRLALNVLRGDVAEGRAPAGGRATVRELEGTVRPLDTQAPTVSDQAYRERLGGRATRERPQWELEAAAWRAARTAMRPAAVESMAVSNGAFTPAASAPPSSTTTPAAWNAAIGANGARGPATERFLGYAAATANAIGESTAAVASSKATALEAAATAKRRFRGNIREGLAAWNTGASLLGASRFAANAPSNTASNAASNANASHATAANAAASNSAESSRASNATSSIAASTAAASTAASSSAESSRASKAASNVAASNITPIAAAANATAATNAGSTAASNSAESSRASEAASSTAPSNVAAPNITPIAAAANATATNAAASNAAASNATATNAAATNAAATNAAATNATATNAAATNAAASSAAAANAASKAAANATATGVRTAAADKSPLPRRPVDTRHPVDRLLDNIHGLNQSLAASSIRLGNAALRGLDHPTFKRAAASADVTSNGAARAWTERARGTAQTTVRRAMAYQDRVARADAETKLEGVSTTGGSPLPENLRGNFEGLFNQSLGHVRIHTDAAAAHAAESSGAKAVTLGSHIYFNLGNYAPASELGKRLLIHELTHVVQHDQGRISHPASGRVELSSPSDAHEVEARAMESRASELGSSTGGASHTTSAPKTGTRASRDVFGWVGDKAKGAANWVGDRVNDVEQWGEEQIEKAVMAVAPGLARLVKEGPGGLIKEAIEPAVKGWVGTITGGINPGQVIGQIKGTFTSAMAVLNGAKAGDERCCQTLINGINAIRSLASAFMNNPVFDAIKSIFTKVSDVIGMVTKLVLGPAFEILKTIVGGAWDAVKGVASTIQGWFDAVKKIASKAFDWLAKKLGFPSGTGEGGLLDWLQQKAAEIWEQIKKTLQPVIGPLKVVAGVLLMFTGLPEIYAIIKYGPQIVEAVQWLWANRNNPDAVKQNPQMLGGSILPKILGAGQSFVGFVKTGVAWLIDKTGAFATGALQLLGAISGIPLLDMAKGFVQVVVDGANSFKDFAVTTFQTAEQSLESLFHKVVDFIKPYSEVLCSIATAVVNPTQIPLILAGWAWRWLPDCIKPPLIDLLLDAVIKFLSSMPNFPLLGPLWPLLKSGVIGFMQAVRGRDDATKIAVSNKVAKLMAGASPMFLFGFVKGLLRGVWDGIKMPFEAIWMVAQGIKKAGDFFVALGSEADHKATPGKPGATSPASTPAATTTPTPRPPQPAPPSVPGTISAGEAPSVVAGIVAQLNATKPPRPAPAAAQAQPQAAAATATAPKGAAPTNEYRELGSEAKRMAGELSGPAKTVETRFWPAVQQLFAGGGKSMSLDDLMAKLSVVWHAAEKAVASMGAKVANMICDWFMKDEAEEQLGDTIGYLVGMIAFQALLDYLSAGTWTGAMGVISAIAKFLNWPMEFLGEAMKVLKELGGFIMKGLKELGGMIAEAGAGALREVTGAFSEIATKLGEFADELLAKFKGGAAVDDAGTRAAADDAAKTAAGDAGRDGAAARDGKPHGDGDGKPTSDDGKPANDDGKPKDRDGNSAAEQELEKAEELASAIEISRAIVHAEDAGHIPAPAIALSLEPMKARYTWIKTYVAEPAGAFFELFLIASRHSVGRTTPRPPNPTMDEWRAFRDDEFIAKYRERFPSTGYDDAQILKFRTEGKLPGENGGFFDFKGKAATPPPPPSPALADANYVQCVADFHGMTVSEVTDFYEGLMAVGADHNALIDAVLTKYPGITRAEADAIYGYTTKLFYRDLNQVLAGGVITPEAERLSQLLQDALKKMPSSADIQYRGLRLAGPAEVAAFDAEYKVGEIIETKGFWSTAPSAGAAYPGGRSLVIHTTEAKDISELAFGVNFHPLVGKPPYPHEGIIPPGVRFRVTGVDSSTGVVTLEQI